MEEAPINKIKQFFRDALLMKVLSKGRFEKEKSLRIRHPLGHARRKLPRPVNRIQSAQ